MFRRRPNVARKGTDVHRPKRAAAAAVEAAIILPVFIVLILYFMQFAWYFMILHTVQSAARHGARSWAVQDYTETEARQRVEQFLSNHGFTAAEFQVSSSVQNNNLITVTVSIPATAGQVVLTGDPFGIITNWSGPLTGKMTMRAERNI